jgi:hypothetical protein
MISLLLCLAGCAFFAVGTSTSLWIGLFFVELSYVFDCADGQLARYRHQFSVFGGWMDQVSDRVKEFAIYFSLAYGFMLHNPTDTWIWEWALLALFALYLLEYLGQIRFATTPAPEKPLNEALSMHSENPSSITYSDEGAVSTRFAVLQRFRGFVPFRGFIIGEQYFALVPFLILHAVVPLFYFVAVIGWLMCIYRPTVQWYKWKRGYA